MGGSSSPADTDHFHITCQPVVLDPSEGEHPRPVTTFLGRDPISAQIIYHHGTQLCIWDPARGRTAPRRLIDIGSGRPRLVQLSSSSDQLCAVLFSDDVLALYDGGCDLVAQQIFDSVEILSLCWIDTSLASLLLVTTTALLFYHVDIANRCLNLIRAHSRSTIASWFLAPRRVLVTADPSNQFDLWIMRPAAPRKTLRFGIGRLATAPAGAVRRQIDLVDLYQHPTLIFVDETGGRLHLYLIQSSALVPTHSFDLFETGPARIYLSDDVLIVFVDGRPQIPLIFDTRASSNAPIISPLPLSMPPGWIIIQPDLICASNQIVQIRLRLQGIIDSWGIADPEPLLLFLTRRSNAQSHLQRVLTDQILHERLSDGLCRSLALLASVDPKRRSSISQSAIVDVFRAVSGKVPGQYLETVAFVYLQKLLEAHIGLDDALVHCIVDILVRNQRYHHLQQCLQYHLLPDSAQLGLHLCHIGRDLYPPCYQLGLDMLYRSAAYEQLLDQVLDTEHPRLAVLALRFVCSRSQLISKLDLPDPVKLLQLVLEANDPILFDNVMRSIQIRKLVGQRDIESGLTTSSCEDLVKLVTDRYGPLPPV